MLNVLCTAEELAAIVRQVVREENAGKTPGNIQKMAEIIDTPELCKRLNVSLSTVARYRQKNKIPYLLLGDSIRYNWEKVLKAIEK